MSSPSDKQPRPPARLFQSRPTSPPLGIELSYRFGAPLIYVTGELDHNSANGLREAIDEELAGRPPALLLEVSRLVYVDSGGLSLLFDTVRRFQGGEWLGIVNPSPNVRRVMEMTGLTERSGIRIIADLAGVPAALAELPG